MIKAVATSKHIWPDKRNKIHERRGKKKKKKRDIYKNSKKY